jgi:predicted nucleotidyltransferase
MTTTHETSEIRLGSGYPLSRLVSEIVSEIDEIAQIIVYGSAARGDGDRSSDIDLVVLTERVTHANRLDYIRRIRRLFRGWNIPLDITVLTPGEFRKGKSMPGHIASTCSREGKVIYDR